jgi:hypothetical protein
VLAALVPACNDSKSRFSPSSLPSGSPRVVGLTIAGPDRIPPGATEQYRLVEHLNDGSSRDAVGEVTWRSTDESVLSVSPAGTATGRNRGEASISASFSASTAVKPAVMVIPPGTFKLEGTVMDAGFPVPGVRVAVVAGEGTGQSSSVTDDRFRLYGVVGAIEVRATAPGYTTATERLTVSGHQFHTFNMTPSAPREQLAGRYTLTIAAASSCAALLPEPTRVRTYAAIVTQSGPELSIKLENAQFYRRGDRTYDRFVGTVQAGRVIFNLFDLDYYFYYDLPAIIEQVPQPASHLLSISGTVFSMVSGRSRSGTLNGQLKLTDGYLQRTVAVCGAADHRFTLSR